MVPPVIVFFTEQNTTASVNMIFSLLFGFVVLLFVSLAIIPLLEKNLLKPIDEIGFEALTIVSKKDIDREKMDVGADPNLRFIAFALNYALKQLSYEKLRGSQLISDVSHEFKTPLTSIISSLELLEMDQGSFSAQSKELFEILKSDVNYFEELVLDLLKLAKLENDAVSTEVEEIDLKKWLKENVKIIAENLSKSFENKVIKAPKIIVKNEKISISPLLFERIMSNLIANAYIHGEQCEKIIVSKKLSEIWIEIFDNGKGIPNGEEEKIFERFYRSTAIGDRGKVKGTGLGLSIVSSFVDLAGGRVWAYNRQDSKGACFVVSFPT